jgi:formylglycine-generating enzyme required for sulfatase activity
MLPTEAQWQYAAQGTDGRTYPWGDEWDAARCNTSESGLGKTTPVRQYEGRGDSPFGVVDLAGNVWEWCLTDYEKNTNDVHSPATRRVLRGGAWFNILVGARAAFRSNFPSNLRYDFIGFRVSVRPPSR